MRVPCRGCFRLVPSRVLRVLDGKPLCGECRKTHRGVQRRASAPRSFTTAKEDDRWFVQWLKSDARDAVCYRKALTHFGLTCRDELRQLPLARQKEFESFWTKLIIHEAIEAGDISAAYYDAPPRTDDPPRSSSDPADATELDIDVDGLDDLPLQDFTP